MIPLLNPLFCGFRVLEAQKEAFIMLSLDINGKTYQVDAAPDEPLLWVIRERLQLTGTKYGCGIGACGSCTVHIDGKAERSCQVPAASAQGKKITTIEGLGESHAVVKAWIREQVPQCGYCQPGQIMQAAALLTGDPNPSDDKILSAMDGNLCRCGTYTRIRMAIKSAAKEGRRS
jgi:isoquinoline 1-oxidoreductase alpha subunit